jgi:hypothetical protein
MLFNITRINKENNIVENIEVADQEWIDSQKDNPDFYFLKYDNDETIPYRPFMGYEYNKEEGWYHYPIVPWIGDYTEETLKLFETEPELKEKLETLENGSKEFALVVREIEQKLI